MTEQAIAQKGAVSMEITRALATLKQIEKEITEYFNTDRLMIGVRQGLTEDPKVARTAHAAYPTVDKLVAKIQGDIDGLDNLRRRQFEIKRKILHSNSVTTVVIGGVQMTVTEAIYQKSLLASRKDVLNKQKASVKKIMDAMVGIDVKFKEQLTDLESNLKKATDDVRSLRENEVETHKKINTPSFVDPKGIHKLIEQEQQAINDLETNLDYALSISNTKTFITVQE